MSRKRRSSAIAALFPALEVTELQVGAKFKPHVEHEGQPGWVQGGFVATVLDYVCARAAGEFFGVQAITGELSLRYRAPVLLDGGPFTVSAEPRNPVGRRHSRSARIVRISGLLSDAEGAALVTAAGLFVRQPRTG